MKILMMTLLFISQFAYASTRHGGGEGGDRVGNGGDIVVCTQLSGEVIYILEEYETTRSPDLGSKGLNYKQKIDILLNRIKMHFPERYIFYVNALEYFEKNVTFRRPSLPEINDARESISYSCEITQAAYFKKDKDGNLNYYIQKSLWDLMTEDQKAILVMHEILYTEAVGLGHEVSTYIRHINRTLFINADYDPSLVDDLFLKPIRNLTQKKSVSELIANTYSARIATYLLQQDITKFYGDQKFRSNLHILKKRFLNNARVKKLIVSHEKAMSLYY